MNLFDELKTASESEWLAYIRHEFVQLLGEGTLPLPVFQDYLVQDYLFLIQFARVHALAVSKSRTLADIIEAHQAMTVILDETRLHRRLMQRWGIDLTGLEATPERQATVAYTRYVLDTGHCGDLLDLHVALAPCIIGYAEIGTALVPAVAAQPEHPYREWITEYASEGYQASASDAIKRLDALADGPLTPRRSREIKKVFATATRLEADFWQQALDHASRPIKYSNCNEKYPSVFTRP